MVPGGPSRRVITDRWVAVEVLADELAMSGAANGAKVEKCSSVSACRPAKGVTVPVVVDAAHLYVGELRAVVARAGDHGRSLA
jgi:hypothetical protein